MLLHSSMLHQAQISIGHGVVQALAHFGMRSQVGFLSFMGLLAAPESGRHPADHATAPVGASKSMSTTGLRLVSDLKPQVESETWHQAICLYTSYIML